MSKQSRSRKMHSDSGMRFKTLDDESVTVRISKKGVLSLTSSLNPDHGGLGSFIITGLDPKKAAAKKKSFFRSLWNKIKSAAAAIVDAVTVPLFGYRCRPDIGIDIKGRGVTFGISCNEA